MVAEDTEAWARARINFRYHYAWQGVTDVGNAIDEGRLPERYRPLFAKEMLERWQRDGGGWGSLGAFEALELIEFESDKYDPDKLDAEILRLLRESGG